MTIIYAILMFCLLIFIHEFGHFIAAKICDVKVNEFSVGMGPAFFKKQKGETLYALRIFPIGGYCAMEGEDEDSDDPRAFNKKGSLQKAIIVVAGAFMNFLMALIIFYGIFFFMGEPVPVVDKVIDNSPAMEAGLIEGDKIVSINGKEVITWEDLGMLVDSSDTEQLKIEVQHKSGSVEILNVGVDTNENGDRSIGIYAKREKMLGTSLVSGTKTFVAITVGMLDIIKMLFTGDVPATELSGPIGIVATVNETSSLGFMYLAYLAAIISINLGIMNLLPFPALDGGRLIFIIIRKITGKAITDATEAKVHFAGILILFALMIYVTWNDILKFIVPIFS